MNLNGIQKLAWLKRTVRTKLYTNYQFKNCCFLVSQSLSNINESNDMLTNIENISSKNKEKFEQWNKTIGVNLQELRDKIAKAKHAAEGVRI